MSLRSWIKNVAGIAWQVPPALRPEDIKPSLDTNNPPRSGSGVPRKPFINRAADMSNRGDVIALINEPIRVVIGTQANPRVVNVCEPTNAEFGEYASLINLALAKLVQSNTPLIRAGLKGEPTDKLSLDLAPLDGIIETLVAKIVGEDEDFVRHEMTKKQTVAIVHAFLDALGWDFIKENFQMAATAWARAAKAASKNGNDVEPPWPQKQSPPSAEHIPR